MESFELQPDEVVLYTGTATCKAYKGTLRLTLTSQKLVISFFEKEKGLFKKDRVAVDMIPLERVKFYNDTAQIKQKGSEVEIQTIEKNLTIVFSGMLEARKFYTSMINASTGTTIAQRRSNAIKAAFAMADDVLGLDTRGVIKDVLENGAIGTLLNGISKKK